MGATWTAPGVYTSRSGPPCDLGLRMGPLRERGGTAGVARALWDRRWSWARSSRASSVRWSWGLRLGGSCAVREVPLPATRRPPAREHRPTASLRPRGPRPPKRRTLAREGRPARRRRRFGRGAAGSVAKDAGCRRRCAQSAAAAAAAWLETQARCIAGLAPRRETEPAEAWRESGPSDLPGATAADHRAAARDGNMLVEFPYWAIRWGDRRRRRQVRPDRPGNARTSTDVLPTRGRWPR